MVMKLAGFSLCRTCLLQLNITKILMMFWWACIIGTVWTNIGTPDHILIYSQINEMDNFSRKYHKYQYRNADFSSCQKLRYTFSFNIFLSFYWRVTLKTSKLTPVHWKPFQVTTSLSRLRECQECKQSVVPFFSLPHHFIILCHHIVLIF